jgi:hypothetical protein
MKREKKIGERGKQKDKEGWWFEEKPRMHYGPCVGL